MIKKIVQKIGDYRNNFDKEKVEKAFASLSLNASTEEQRKSVAILELLLPLKPDEEMIVTVLLYQVFSDDQVNEETIKQDFGSGVLNILCQLKKLLSIDYSENDKSAQVEILRKMFFSMAKDLRVILILLAFRLYQMKNLDQVEDQKQSQMIAKETLDLYAPIASRLGIYRMKNELEELGFKYTKRDEHEDIFNQLKGFGKTKTKIIALIEKQLKDFLKGHGYEAEVYGRTKAIYSIYKKFKKKNVNSVDDLYDVFAIRIILPSKKIDGEKEFVDHLYQVLGLIHGNWSPISQRFKDYIAIPKPNGYRSLHTVVLGLAPGELDQPVEIQIRSSDMHDDAEYGVASHWFYKEGKEKAQLESHVDWLIHLREIQSNFSAENESLDQVTTDIFKDRIFVLTPRGEVKDLPMGSTPIDFAYNVHTELGHKCIMAKANGKVVPLDYELENGEVVEISTRKDSQPKLQWLSFVKTNHAKNKIRNWFSEFDRERNMREGKRLLNEYLVRLGKPSLDQNYSVLKNYAGQKLNLVMRESLLEEIGKGTKLPGDTVKKIYPYEEILEMNLKRMGHDSKKERKKVKIEDAQSLLEDRILVGGEAGLPIKIAKCCLPKYGERIKGYVTRGNSISLHKQNCNLLDNLSEKRFIPASWKGVEEEPEGKKYRVKLKLTLIKRVGLLRDIASVISSLDISIVDVLMKDGQAKVHDSYFVLDMKDPQKFDVLLNKLTNLDAVLKVVRQD